MDASVAPKIDPIASDSTRSTTGIYRSAVALGLAITLTQVLIAFVVSLFAGSPRGYEALYQWDSGWYERILVEGYHSPEVITAEEIGTAGFFPGYPVATRLVMTLTGLPAHDALLVTAQLCCWGFWTYFLLACQNWGLSPRVTAWCVLLFNIHPVSFILIADYSESLFLMSVMGFIFWSCRPGLGAATLAVIHGIAMTATRLVGLPLVAVPLVYALSQVQWSKAGALAMALRRGTVPFLVGCCATLGALSFFLFCQLQFGHWDQYMRTQRSNWQVKTDYWTLLSGRFLLELQPGPQEHLLHPCFLCRVAVPILMTAFLAILFAELRSAGKTETRWRERLPLYFCAIVLFIVPVITTCRYVSMLRYSIPVVALLIVSVGQLVSRHGLPMWASRSRWAQYVGVTSLTALHLLMLSRFLHGWWTA